MNELCRRAGIRLITAVAFSCFGVSAAVAHSGGDPGPAPIVQWDQILQQNLVGSPFPQVRIYAMMHIAMADAAVAIEGEFEPYDVRLWPIRGASSEAAVAQAAHDVLVAQLPAGVASYDAALQTTLAALPPGRRFLGIAIGKAAAASVLNWRKNDGIALANPQPASYLASNLPGIWKQTATGSAQFSEFGQVLPFAVKTPTQFLPAPFPQLESPEYAASLNEVKDIGRAVSVMRMPEQARSASLWAGVGAFANVTNPFRVWHNVARDLAVAKGLSLVETARLFALLSVAINDGLQTAHTSKFIYRLWRPETAIAGADRDDNPATVAEPGWAPLIPTPPYPSHASNMTCIGMAAARVLADLLGGDAQSFNAVWYTGASPPVPVHTQPFSSLHALAMDEANSRIWGGVHFRFEIDAAEVSCTQVGAYVYDHFMQPTRRPW